MLWYVTWTIAALAIGVLLILLIREVLRMRVHGGRVSARLTAIIAAIYVIGMVAIIGPNIVDESRLDRQFKPLLERDYGGWDYEVFSY